jgi:uncharacterized protein
VIRMPSEEYKALRYLNQKQRLMVLLLNVCILLLLSKIVTGEILPSSSGKRLWVLAGLGYFFLTLLTAPWFRPPRNALVNAVTAALLLSTLDLAGVQTLRIPLDIFRWSFVGVAVATCICAILAIAFADLIASGHPYRRRVADLCYRISDIFGKGELIFTPPALISILGYYQQAAEQQLWLLFGWVLIITIRPVELVFRLIGEIRVVSGDKPDPEVLGIITRVDNPNIIRVALTSSKKWQPNTVAVACLPNGNQVNVLCLFSHIEESQLVGTGLCHDALERPIEGIVPGNVYEQPVSDDVTRIVNELSGLNGGANLVGFVVEDSSISVIRFEVSSNIPIEEGVLIFCRLGNQTVFYQILDARTAEESFERNPRGKHVVSAAQLGCLDSQKGFVKYGWLPTMNSPVFVPKEPVEYTTPSPEKDEFIIGKVPGSHIGVRAGFFDMLEYHTAILGVTGTGKTEFAFDIIRQALSLGTKVFCVDFTNEYKARLTDSSPQLLGLDQEQAKELDQKLFAVETGTYGAGKEKAALKEFVDKITDPIKNKVKTFLSSEGASLGIFELPEITNTKATLRATELYLSSIMEWARNNRRARKVLVVLEEAHTIIPETAGAGFDYDTQWVVGRISQIALQGRKYGVGLLIVSQRTALVSKSILSQCNTCIAFSLVDKTSLDYLANVYTSAHVQSIPNLRFLEAVAYGKAIRSERPILVKLDYVKAKKTASDVLNKREEATS